MQAGRARMVITELILWAPQRRGAGQTAYSVPQQTYLYCNCEIHTFYKLHPKTGRDDRSHGAMS